MACSVSCISVGTSTSTKAKEGQITSLSTAGIHSSCQIDYTALETLENQWRKLFINALKTKNAFEGLHKDTFFSLLVSEASDFTKDIFLDPIQQENPCFVLPQLTRETYTQKGIFYRTEKIIVLNYYNCFSTYTVD